MKKLFTLLAICAVVASTSCSKDDNYTPSTPSSPDGLDNYTDRDGEALVLSSFTNWNYNTATNVYTALDVFDLNSNDLPGLFNGVLFSTNDGVAQWNAAYDCAWSSWSGFAVSQNMVSSVSAHDGLDGYSADYSKEFAAVCTADADGDDTFAVCYYNGWDYAEMITFTEAQNLSSISVGTSAIAASYDGSESMTLTITGTKSEWVEGVDGSWFQQITTVATKSVELFDSSYDSAISGDWQSVDLSDFDGVETLTFSVSSSDNDAPTYFVVDALTFE